MRPNNLTEKMTNIVMAAAAADAFAMPMMSRSQSLIRQDIGNGQLVTTLVECPPGAPGTLLPKGSVTDVFAGSAALLYTVLQNGGQLTANNCRKGLLQFKNGAGFSPYFVRFAGTATRQGLEKLEGTYVTTRFDKSPCEWRSITSGAVARSWVAGLLNPSDPKRAIHDAVLLSLPTHPNAIAISGAAVCAALTAISFDEKLDTGKLYDQAQSAAELGFELGVRETGMSPVGAKLQKRMELAANIAVRYGNNDEALLRELNDVIGFGAYASEVVPSALGLIIASGCSAGRAAFLAANAGNNANRSAVIAATALAAFSGLDDLLTQCYQTALAASGICFADILRRLAQRAEQL